MAKSDVPILEIRPYDGGLRRFAVVSLEPIASGKGTSLGDGTLPLFLVVDFWERVENRGIVARIKCPGPGASDPDQNYIGTSEPVAPIGCATAETALKRAWNIVLQHYAGDGLKLPPELLVVAKDYDAEKTPPAIE